jgi:serine/threonine protein kinase
MATERMNDGTDRMDAGTARMDAGTARMDGSKGGAVTSAGVVFVSGQTIVLNGKNCVIDSVISGNTGEAIVYKVTIDNRPYALKLYKPNTPLSDTAVKVITKIKDNQKDKVIKIYDFGKYNEQDFEVMEYAEGGTLEQYIKSSGAIRDMTKIKNIVKMITEGLEQLHNEYKVIYQDLKPENIYFKDANKTSLVLADFGISSIMEGYEKEVEVTASITDLYAAPELARMGNETKVIVTPAIDYFALGITMFELWLGEKPFKGIKGNSLRSKIRNEEISFPTDMPDDYATIIQGLIRSRPKDRWGNEQVKKWLKGEALTLESKASQKTSTAYDLLKFSNTESAASPKELAALMEKYPDIGKTVLYDGIIKEWCKKAGDLELYNKIQNITSQYKDKDAGLYTAILNLDPERPFKSQGGKICVTGEDIANAIMAESAYYMEDLKKSNANLYLYLAETEGPQGKEAADIFCKNFKEYSPRRALALVYLKLQGDGGITIGNKRYQSPKELKSENDAKQIDLIKEAVKEKDSMLKVWLSDIYGNDLKSTDTFNNLSAPEQFFLIGLLPYLSFKEINGGNLVLPKLIDLCPGRADLFEIYAAQGLSLTVQDCGNYNKTPIDYAVCNFTELRNKHGNDTIRNMIRLLCKLGADVNEYSGDGTCPLINAYNAKMNDLAKLLLELGADENQYRVYKEKRDEQERIDRERREEQDRIDRKRREEQARRDREERERQEAARRREEDRKKREEAKEKAKNKIGHLLQFLPIIVGAAFIIITFILADQYVDTPIINLILMMMGTVIPIILLYNGILYILSFIVFLGTIALFVGTFFAHSQLMPLLIHLLIGSISMVVAFILALVYPKGKQVKNLKGILIPVIAVLLMFGFFIIMQTVSFFKYEKNDQDTLTVTGYFGKRDVVIPAVKKGVSVTEIGDEAFANKRITRVTIPNSITSINQWAFKNNNLTSVDIPVGVTYIGGYAFADNQLTSVTIPDSVTTIGERAFYGNQLTAVTIPNSVTSIGERAFADNQLTAVIIPNSVTSIGERAFAGNNLTDVTIPNSITSIKERVFSGNPKLRNVVIPNGVTSVGDYAFSGSNLTNVVLPNSVTSVGINAFPNTIISIRIGANVKLGSKDDIDALGKATGFNTAYDKNGKRAGTYTRLNKDNTTWTRK